jgi:hypothetical protein
MMGKLPKSKAWKQSDPDRPRLLLHPRHSNKLEPRNSVGPRRIPVELLRSSYEEGYRHVGRTSGPQSLATLPTRLHLATTLRMGALQVESPKCGVCSDFH